MIRLAGEYFEPIRRIYVLKRNRVLEAAQSGRASRMGRRMKEQNSHRSHNLTSCLSNILNHVDT